MDDILRLSTPGPAPTLKSRQRRVRRAVVVSDGGINGQVEKCVAVRLLLPWTLKSMAYACTSQKYRNPVWQHRIDWWPIFELKTKPW